MFWEEDTEKKPATGSDRVTDVCFKVDCRSLPAMHATELAQALRAELPWIVDEPEMAIHQIHGATTGNGWERPGDDELIQLSRRTRLVLRVPQSRVDDAAELTGRELDIAGNRLRVGDMSVRPVTPLSTLFARYVADPLARDEDDEDRFLHWAADELRAMAIPVKKLLCGKRHTLTIEGRPVLTRTLMVADLDSHASIRLQERGLGEYRQYGCGIFLPHKGIKPVSDGEDKSHFSGV